MTASAGEVEGIGAATELSSRALEAIARFRVRRRSMTAAANRPNRRRRSARIAPSSRRASANSTEATGRIRSSGSTTRVATTRFGATISGRTYGDRNYYGSYPNRNYGYYSNRGYGYSNRRYITPRFVTVVPYRPYVYRPSIGIGVYYGSGGSYPYGYTPRGYYDPIVGRAYGGLRITGASRIAQVFADGYYVGIVNDFDGVFQHLNLEAGPHQIEIREPGFAADCFRRDDPARPDDHVPRGPGPEA